ncbi:MAG: S24 family peptidase [Rhabdaerophilum calidifontis]
MLTHAQIWAAIDALAQRQGLSISSLAKRAGLDPTTFNRSKRINAEGQARWPSTESIAKVLAATGVGVDEFLGIVTGQPRPGARLPFRPLEAGLSEAFDEGGRPRSRGWDEINFPGRDTTGLFAIEVRGKALAPVYADGDILIVSHEAPTRRGDRVFVLPHAGMPMIAVLGHQTATHVQFFSVTGESLPARPAGQIRAICRILWASQ